MDDLVISVDDPRRADVQALLERHLAFAHATTPIEDVHALDVSGLLEPSITFLSARRTGELLGVGALRDLGGHHGELKSMHTAAEARGQGVGRAMVACLLAEARRRGMHQVSLETGSMEAFAPARALYASAGFTACGPFGPYPLSPNSAYMTLVLDGDGDGVGDGVG